MLLCACLAQAQTVIHLDASKPGDAPKSLWFPIGGKAPDGTELGANSRYLTLNGQPWFPVMAEMHFSRYPESMWEEEILKMKAAGVRIVATYVFWIHHEEVQGKYDWSGQRDLRRFVELCQKHGMYFWLRVGPWAHGEARNGGFPDWLLKAGPVRENNPVYLSHVHRLFAEISGQVKGLWWKDGGPIIGVQIENEYHARGEGKGTEHILTLYHMAREVGMNAPYYTITGWDNAVLPSREVLPVFGGYSDAFWSTSLRDLPPNSNYLFSSIRAGENMAADDLRSKNPTVDAQFTPYPFLTAEMGGGMQVAYHRRPVMHADDIAATLLAKLGSGVNLYGYYMFHGGTNPEGKLTTLQESQLTNYPQDLPVASYDFQAPLGEFGQMRPSLRRLKSFHMFLRDFGSYLAPMHAAFPDVRPASMLDTDTPRVAARVQSDHGFVFVNNYARNLSLNPKRGLQLVLKTATETVEIPRRPVDVPSGAYFLWPVNLDLKGALLKYATVQPLSRLDAENTFFFFATPGIAPEFAFDPASVTEINAPGARIETSNGRLYVSGITPGTGLALTVHPKHGAPVREVVLTREQAEDCWKSPAGTKERMVCSPADLYFNGERVELRSRDRSKLRLSVFPALDRQPTASARPTRQGRDGVFASYSFDVPGKTIDVQLEQLRKADPSSPVRMGKKVALAPADADFEKAAIWKLRVPEDALSNVNDAFLRISYQGDVARIYANDHLLTDDFYKGTDWEIGLKRFARQLDRGLEIRILPLRADAPVYIPQAYRPYIGAEGEVANITKITVEPEYAAEVDLGKK
jgi:hypothetical protein